jgi:hypothetical protein
VVGGKDPNIPPPHNHLHWILFKLVSVSSVI